METKKRFYYVYLKEEWANQSVKSCS